MGGKLQTNLGPMSKRAVLLVNLGSPESTSVPHVRRYLREFLGDERVIDIRPRWLAKLLVNCVITPTRAPKSSKAYQEIWTAEGSPLVVTSKRVREKLAAELGSEAPVYLAMRYDQPSIASVLAQMVADGVTDVLLFPQYPHYAMSSWETVVVKVQEEAAKLARYAGADATALKLAWVYVLLRIAHSLVQATINRVIVRFGIFALGTLVLMAFMVRQALRILG